MYCVEIKETRTKNWWKIRHVHIHCMYSISTQALGFHWTMTTCFSATVTFLTSKNNRTKKLFPTDRCSVLLSKINLIQVSFCSHSQEAEQFFVCNSCCVGPYTKFLNQHYLNTMKLVCHLLPFHYVIVANTHVLFLIMWC